MTFVLVALLGVCALGGMALLIGLMQAAMMRKFARIEREVEQAFRKEGP